MSQPVDSITLRILHPNGKTVGTAFLIAPGLAVTCAHVVFDADAYKGDSIQVQFTEQTEIIYAVVVPEYWSDVDEFDVAILKLEKVPASVHPFRMVPAATCRLDAPLYTFGYVRMADHEGISGYGNFRNLHKDGNKIQFFMPEADHGHSGAPILDVDRNVVIGMIKWGEDKGGRNYATTFAIPVEIIQQVCSEIKITSSIHTIKPLPRIHLLRQNDFEEIKNHLLAPKNYSDANKRNMIAIHGMSGIGKSVLAAAIANDMEVQGRFNDGVFWITISQTPDLTTKQIELAGKVEPYEAHNILDPKGDGVSKLKALLSKKNCLLILDDVWDKKSLQAFDVVDENSFILITCRDSDILHGVDATLHEVNPLNEDDALQLLAKWTGKSRNSLPPEARTVAKKCGNLPLALAVVGAMAKIGEDQHKTEQWNKILRLFNNAHLEKLKDVPGLEYEYKNLKLSIKVGLDDLEAEHGGLYDFFLSLAIFPEDAFIPESVLQAYWMELSDKLDKDDVIDYLDILTKRSLLYESDNRYHLHDVLRMYIQKQAGNLNIQNRSLLKTFPAWGGGIWPVDTDGNYFYKELIYHLHEAGDHQHITSLLLDFSWLQAKIMHTDIDAVISDYDRVETWDIAGGHSLVLRKIRNVLKLSGSILQQDKYQLAAQLLARLNLKQHPELVPLLDQAQKWTDHPWLQPLSASLRQSDLLLWPMYGHSKSVTHILPIGSSGMVLSASGDKTLIAWDVERSKKVFMLSGHQGTPTALAVTPDGKFAISGSVDGEVIIWNLQEECINHSFPKFKNYPVAIACTLDSKGAVVVYNDGEFRFVNLKEDTEEKLFQGPAVRVHDLVFLHPDMLKAAYDNGQLLTLKIMSDIRKVSDETHPELVTAFAADNEGIHAVAGHGDGTITIWNNSEARSSRAFHSGQNAAITAVAWIGGQRGLSVSNGDFLQVWDFETGKELVKFYDTPGPIYAACAVKDRIITASADHSLKVWDLSGKDEQNQTIFNTSAVTSIAAGKDRCISARINGELILWDVLTRKIIFASQISHGHVTASIIMTGERKAVLGTSDGNLFIWDIEHDGEPELIYSIPSSASSRPSIYGIGQLPGINTLVLGSSNRILTILDLSNIKSPIIQPAHSNVIKSLEVFDQGRKIITSSYDGLLKIWDTQSWQTLFALGDKKIKSKWSCVATFPDGERAVSVSISGQIVLWDLKSQQEIRSWAAEPLRGQSINQVLIFPEMNTIATISDDHTVRAWDIEGLEICRFTGDSAFLSCDMLNNRQTLVVGDKTGRIHFLKLFKP